MLFAYALAGEATLTTETIQALRRSAEDLAQATCGTFGFDWESLVPGTRVEGTFLRGYRHVASEGEALWIVEGLRRLSERFPEYTLYISGGGALPMTQLKAGRFELFGEIYARALAPLVVELVRPQPRGARAR